LGTKFNYQLAQLAKFLCEAELNGRIFSMEGGYGGELFFAIVCKLVTNNTCDLKCWQHKVLLCHIFGYKVGGKGSKFGYIKPIKNK
jgi:hypothetical protein